MPTSPNEPINWRLIVGFWLALGAILMVRPLWLGDRFLLQADDVMRLVSVAQWQAGAPFQDNLFVRDNAPFGATLHWSRLIDIPLTGIILLVRPFAGANAPIIASMIWPVLLFLPLMCVSALTVRRLGIGGSILPAIVLLISSGVTLGEFMPTRVDHHNIQVVLTAALALSIMLSRSKIWAAWVAGLLAATSLAIGMETLPAVVLALGLYALLWAAFPQQMRGATQAFGTSFAACTALHFLIATPASVYLTVACDVISIPYVAASAFAAMALWFSTLVGQRIANAWGRATLVSGAGLAAVASILLLYPECRFGPYSQVDAELLTRLFPAILEARPVWELAAFDPGHTISLIFVPVLAFCVTLGKVVTDRSDNRVDWAILLAFLTATLIIGLLQIRGLRMVGVFTAPAGMLVINAARDRYLVNPGKQQAALLIGSWLLFAQATHQVAIANIGRVIIELRGDTVILEAMANIREREQCFEQHSFGDLAALPASRLIAPIRIGPHVLLFTNHSIIAAGFHRNAQGILDNLWFYNGSEEQARRIARERNLDYVVACNKYPEIALDEIDDGSFHALEDQARHWAWLTPMSATDAPLQIFRVERDRLDFHMPAVQ